jgi:hypothetical protein
MLLAGMALLLLPGAAAAQVTPAAGYTPPDDTQSIRVGATLFFDYTYSVRPKTTDVAGNRISSSAFNVARAYLNVTGSVSHLVAFRLTPDVTRETGTGSSLAGSLTVRLKYGYAQLNLDDWTGAWRQSYVRVGIQGTPYVDWFDSFYRYRFQGTDFAERDGGMSSADAGISFHTTLPRSFGDVHAGLFNGEGYSRAETNDQKAFQVRGTFRPVPRGEGLVRGLRVTIYHHGDHYVRNAERRRVIANVSIENRRFNAAFDYMNRADQTLPTAARVESVGYSFFVNPFFKERGNGLEALVRFDSFRANSRLAARQNRLIVGGAYWFPHTGGNATAALLLDYEQVTFVNYTTDPPPRQQRVFLHGLISF